MNRTVQSFYNGVSTATTYNIDTGPQYNTNTNKIYIAPGILKRIGAQTHGVTRR